MRDTHTHTHKHSILRESMIFDLIEGSIMNLYFCGFESKDM